jgi:hypothetical protein
VTVVLAAVFASKQVILENRGSSGSGCALDLAWRQSTQRSGYARRDRQTSAISKTKCKTELIVLISVLIHE